MALTCRIVSHSVIQGVVKFRAHEGLGPYSQDDCIFVQVALCSSGDFGDLFRGDTRHS